MAIKLDPDAIAEAAQLASDMADYDYEWSYGEEPEKAWFVSNWEAIAKAVVEIYIEKSKLPQNII
jgi:hypothetical protein